MPCTQLSVRQKSCNASSNSNTSSVSAGFSSTAMILPASIRSRSLPYTSFIFPLPRATIHTGGCSVVTVICALTTSGYLKKQPPIKNRASTLKNAVIPHLTNACGGRVSISCTSSHLNSMSFSSCFSIILNSPLLKVPVDSSPACNRFLCEPSALRAFPSPLFALALSPLSYPHFSQCSGGAPPPPMSVP